MTSQTMPLRNLPPIRKRFCRLTRKIGFPTTNSRHGCATAPDAWLMPSWQKHGWKLGDRVVIKGNIFPVSLELTIRGIYTAAVPSDTLFFDERYLEESVSWFRGYAGFYAIMVDSPKNVTQVAQAIDEKFHNSPYPTKTETEKAFALDFIATLGNVKAFILGICSAVAFAILLVTATTMAMSVRERTREVAVLKALGYTRRLLLTLFVGESMALALLG